jgi:signal transduction histidine kinase/streptogramin lyase
MQRSHLYAALIGLVLELPSAQPALLESPHRSEWLVRTWSVDEGLPSSTIRTIAQSTDGYLWLGTTGGLVRFDGTHFVLETDFPSALPLLNESCKQLWCTDATGQLLLRERGRLRPVAFPPGAQGKAMSVRGGSDGTSWIQIGTNLHGWRQGGWIESVQVEARVEGQGGEFWGRLGNSYGVWKSGTFSRIDLDSFFPDFETETITPCRGGGAWCFGQAKQRYALIKVSPTGLPAELIFVPWEGWMLLTFITEDARGNLWLGASTHGLLRLGTDRAWEEFNTQVGFPTDVVKVMWEDAEGNIWIGTDGAGLVRLSRRTFQTYGIADGLTTDNVYAVAAGKDGSIWIGAHGSRSEGVFRWVRGQVTFQPGMGPYAWSIHVDPSGDVWAGNFEMGLFRFRHGLVTSVRGAPVNVFAICDDSAGGLWVGGNALAHIDGETIETHKPLPQGSTISGLVSDQTGVLWIATLNHGLFRYAGRKLAQFTTTEGLASDNLLCLYLDRSDALWIGTERGISRLIDGRFVHLMPADGLLANGVSGIAEDNLGNVWIHSRTGISRIVRQELDEFFAGRIRSVYSVSYGREDGLTTSASTVGSQPRICRDELGRMWFATLKGLAMVDPATMPVNTNSPPVILEEILLNGQLHSRPMRSSTDVPVAVEEPVRFGPGVRSFEIRYTATSLRAPEKVRFRYQLKGVQADWVEAGTRRQVFFDQLRPGAYEFTVTACNSDGVWNPTGVALVFSVQPYFWQTTWFKSLGMFSVLSGVALFVRFVSTRQLRRRAAQAEKEAAVERERVRISRDMHDDLGARLTKISLLGELARRSLNQPLAAREHLEKLSRLSSHTAQSLSELIWTVSPANDSLRSLVSHLCEQAEEYLREPSIHCRFEFPDVLPEVTVSSEMRRQVVLAVEEALNNVVKHSGASEVRLGMMVGRSELIISICDNGRGLPETIVPRLGGGHGLMNLQQRLQPLGGRSEISNRPEGGVQVIIRAPLEGI